ncbi:MAG: hypothetical protein HQK63_02125 [Desulfamplus sp.]|nr:hypothetical protein [Desulfamplus sp.]
MPKKKHGKKTEHANHALHKFQLVTLSVPSCKRTDKIPTGVVLSFDFINDAHLAFSPRFSSQFCSNTLMTPFKVVDHK